ncbi:hypothetical protein A7K91_20760 [Paenibacillus oryzae]|uniref:HTH luxR-type domain-containing protein n=1 Tax=Paenibacillus oryzae TaxID=1844972 RepID=A0A1A5YKN1_9BACL|nr:hypothetical protein A7K91_20760 [Paenibacillus oryzae]
MLNETKLLILEQKVQCTRLSSREKSVALLWLQDYDHRVIAQKLIISEHTVRSIVKSIYRKTDVNSKMSLLLKIVFD